MEPNLRVRLRAGDPDAFGVLFDQYAHAAYNMGFRLTGNWSAAEEVATNAPPGGGRAPHPGVTAGPPIRG